MHSAIASWVQQLPGSLHQQPMRTHRSSPRQQVVLLGQEPASTRALPCQPALHPSLHGRGGEALAMAVRTQHARMAAAPWLAAALRCQPLGPMQS